jgi:hypothetical protein
MSLSIQNEAGTNSRRLLQLLALSDELYDIKVAVFKFFIADFDGIVWPMVTFMLRAFRKFTIVIDVYHPFLIARLPVLINGL